MGARNPYRISVDKHTGFLYWGDVGPDAGHDSTGRGPQAYDEINQARKPGFFGWPYFVGDNYAFHNRDFATGRGGAAFDPAKPVNKSVNNTGLTTLPPAQKAFIWYPYAESKEFPLIGKGGRTAMAGPVFYTTDFKNAQRPFPDYYDGKLFIYEWMRGWIMAVTMDTAGNYVSMEHFMPSYRFNNPMDMEFSTNGDLYMLEYGTAWFQGNDDARLVRIEYTAGNRKPAVQLAADKPKGAVPLTVQFSSQGTRDFDRDELRYDWKILSADKTTLGSFQEAHPAFTFDKPGVYQAVLTVTDAQGGQASAQLEVLAGNEPPQLTFAVKGNQSYFFPGQPFDYEVTVADKEDGSLESGGIAASEVSVTIQYLKEGYDLTEIAQGHLQADATAQFATGKKLMEQSDCKSCHLIDKKSIGPRYTDVARKYKGDPKAVDYLVKKVINGGGGVWGEVMMAAHPQLPVADAEEIVNYILSLGGDRAYASLPPKGTYNTLLPPDARNQGVLVLRAAYTDKGANGMASATSEKVIVMKNASVPAGTADTWDGIMKYKISEPPMDLMIGTSNQANIGFKHIDLTGITQAICVVTAPVEVANAAGGTLEVHIDSPTGKLIGQSAPIIPTPGKFTQPKPIIAPIKLAATVGHHDLYYVFKNEHSAAGQVLFVMINIQYVYGPPGTGRAVSMK